MARRDPSRHREAPDRAARRPSRCSSSSSRDPAASAPPRRAPEPRASRPRRARRRAHVPPRRRYSTGRQLIGPARERGSRARGGAARGRDARRRGRARGAGCSACGRSLPSRRPAVGHAIAPSALSAARRSPCGRSSRTKLSSSGASGSCPRAAGREQRPQLVLVLAPLDSVTSCRDCHAGRAPAEPGLGVEAEPLEQAVERQHAELLARDGGSSGTGRARSAPPPGGCRCRRSDSATFIAGSPP